MTPALMAAYDASGLDLVCADEPVEAAPADTDVDVVLVRFRREGDGAWRVAWSDGTETVEADDFKVDEGGLDEGYKVRAEVLMHEEEERRWVEVPPPAPPRVLTPHRAAPRPASPSLACAHSAQADSAQPRPRR